MPTRRQFIFNCSTLTLAASLAPTSFLEKPSSNASPGQTSYDTFLTQRGTVFSVLRESSPAIKLKLVEVQTNPVTYPGAHKAADARNEKFSLMFRGSGSPALQQDTYIFDHSDMGRFAMFIVPVQVQNDRGHHYQAIFNRLPC